MSQEQSQAQSSAETSEVSPLVQAAINLVGDSGPSEEMSATEQLEQATTLEQKVEEVAAEQGAENDAKSDENQRSESEPAQAEAGQEEAQEDKWSLLAKSERKARELAAEKREYEKQLEDLRKRAALAEEMAKDPVAYARNNLSAEDFEKIADDILAGNSLKQKPSKEQSELEQLKSQIEELKQARTSETQQKFINEYKGDIKKSIDEAGGLVKHWPGIEDDVFQFADTYAMQFGEVLTASEATSRIADALTESLKSVHEANPKLLPELLGIRSEPQQQQSKAETKTLTNNLSASVAPNAAEEISEAERIRRATLAFQGRLKE